MSMEISQSIEENHIFSQNSDYKEKWGILWGNLSDLPFIKRIAKSIKDLSLKWEYLRHWRLKPLKNLLTLRVDLTYRQSIQPKEQTFFKKEIKYLREIQQPRKIPVKKRF